MSQFSCFEVIAFARDVDFEFRLPCETSGANQHLIMRNEKNVALQPGYKKEGVLLYIDDLVRFYMLLLFLFLASVP